MKQMGFEGKGGIMTDIVVFGSINMDIIVKTPFFPEVGETIATKEYTMNLGGKAANQACACAKLGKNTVFAACIGDDDFGKKLVEDMNGIGVNTDYLKAIENTNTDIAIVNVDDRGDNKIITTLNTNYAMDMEMVDTLDEAYKAASAVILQMEMPAEVGKYILKKAKDNQCFTVFNQAPVNEVEPSLYEYVDMLVVNEIEAGQLIKKKVTDQSTAKEAARQLLTLGCGSVVITLGSEGAVVATEDHVGMVPAYMVECVDTTAAGDSFVGALAVKMADRASVMEAVQYATAVSGIAVTRVGAAQSIPVNAEVEKFINER